MPQVNTGRRGVVVNVGAAGSTDDQIEAVTPEQHDFAAQNHRNTAQTLAQKGDAVGAEKHFKAARLHSAAASLGRQADTMAALNTAGAHAGYDAASTAARKASLDCGMVANTWSDAAREAALRARREEANATEGSLKYDALLLRVDGRKADETGKGHKDVAAKHMELGKGFAKLAEEHRSIAAESDPDLAHRHRKRARMFDFHSNHHFTMSAHHSDPYPHFG